ncbi:MAG: tetratricopeptide repeat protein [Planctomycetota bacterium]|jgi:hypothetical protein
MKTLKCLLVIIITAVVVLDVPTCAQPVVAQLRQGREKEKARDFDGAIQIYQEITANTGANQRHIAQAHYRMGVCYLRKGDRNSAKQQFERLVSEFPRKLTAVAYARKELKKIRRQERSEEMKRARAGQPGRELTKTNLVSPKGPPTVASTIPANFADDVSPTLNTISITFNQQMMDKSWSWTRFDRSTYPKTTGRPYYDREKKICTLRVKLRPARVYLVGINCGKAKNFKNSSGEKAKAYALVFATADMMGRPTTIPEEMLAKVKAINAGKELTTLTELTKPAVDELLATVPAESLFCVRVNNFEYTLSQIDQFLAGVSPVPMGTSMLVRMQLAKVLGSPELKGVKMGGSFATFGPIPGTDMSDPNNIGILVPVTDYKQFISGNPNISQANPKGVSKITSDGIPTMLSVPVGNFALISLSNSAKHLDQLVAAAKSISENKTTGLVTALDATEAQKAAKEPIWAYGNVESAVKSMGTAVSSKLDGLKMMAGGAMQPSGQGDTSPASAIMGIEKLMKEIRAVSVVIHPEPNVLNITYTMSAVPGTKMADTFFTDSAAMRKLSDKLKEPKQMGAEIKPILALLPEADKADFVGTYNLINQFKTALAFAPVPMPQIDIPTKSNIAFAGKVSKGTMKVDIALPKEHLAELVAGAMMIQQQMMQPMPTPGQQEGGTSQKGLVIKPLVGVGEVRFGMTIEQMKEILGEPQRVTGGRGCEYLDSGFAILSAKDGTVAVIMFGDMSLPDSPLIRNCKCRTDKDIGMGSSRQDVISAYGQPSSTDHPFSDTGNFVRLKYDKLNGEFILRDYKVVHMTFTKVR